MVKKNSFFVDVLGPIILFINIFVLMPLSEKKEPDWFTGGHVLSSTAITFVYGLFFLSSVIMIMMPFYSVKWQNWVTIGTESLLIIVLAVRAGMACSTGHWWHFASSVSLALGMVLFLRSSLRKKRWTEMQMAT